MIEWEKESKREREKNTEREIYRERMERKRVLGEIDRVILGFIQMLHYMFHFLISLLTLILPLNLISKLLIVLIFLDLVLMFLEKSCSFITNIKEG